MAEFVRVESASDVLSDTGLVVVLNDIEIALFRVGQAIYAIENECPHRQGPLGDGDLEGEVVTCPFHGWQVNVRTGEVLCFPELCSRTFQCTINDGEVYVEI